MPRSFARESCQATRTTPLRATATSAIQLSEEAVPITWSAPHVTPPSRDRSNMTARLAPEKSDHVTKTRSWPSTAILGYHMSPPPTLSLSLTFGDHVAPRSEDREKKTS